MLGRGDVEGGGAIFIIIAVSHIATKISSPVPQPRNVPPVSRPIQKPNIQDLSIPEVYNEIFKLLFIIIIGYFRISRIRWNFIQYND